MHVLLLNQYFWPDISAAAQLSTDLAEDLVKAGARVSVITGRQPYAAIEQGQDLPFRETHKGIEITRVPMTGFGRGRLWARSIDDASFLLSAVTTVASHRHVDVVLSLATPPFLATAAMLHKRLYGSRFIYWVQDLFPDVAIELGYLPRTGLATRTLERLTRATFRSADAIVAIGECMAERIAARYGISRQGIDVVHNWADENVIYPIPHADNWFRHQHGLDGKFVVLYSGNMGRGHTFDALVDAARALRDRTDIVFLFIGAGPRLPEVQAVTRGLPNVRFLPYQPREHLAHSLSAADLGVVTLRSEALGTMVPSKTYGHMASARPVLFIGPGASAAARAIAAAHCGIRAAPDDPTTIVHYVERLAGNPAETATLGRAGRTAFEATHTRSELGARLNIFCEGSNRGSRC